MVNTLVHFTHPYTYKQVPRNTSRKTSFFPSCFNLSFYFPLLLLMFQNLLQARLNRSPPRKVFLSTNVRDEKDLPEWIAFHLAVGFDHILIVDHLSQTPVQDLLRNEVIHSQFQCTCLQTFDFEKDETAGPLNHSDAIDAEALTGRRPKRIGPVEEDRRETLNGHDLEPGLDPRWKGKVTIVRYEAEAQHLMKHMILQSICIPFMQRSKADWAIHLDADEFFNPCLPDRTVHQFLAAFGPEVHQVAVNWMLFGSSYHDVQPEGLIIENFCRCTGTSDRHVKSFYRPEQVQEPGGPHFVVLRSQDGTCGNDESKAGSTGGQTATTKKEEANEKEIWRSIDAFGKPMEKGSSFQDNAELPLDTFPALINHYYCQSYERYIQRKVHLRRDDTGQKRTQVNREILHSGTFLNLQGNVTGCEEHQISAKETEHWKELQDSPSPLSPLPKRGIPKLICGTPWNANGYRWEFLKLHFGARVRRIMLDIGKKN